MPEPDLRSRFDRLYATSNAGGAAPPWDREGPHSHVRHWADRRAAAARGDGGEPVGPVGQGRSAVVVGCGYGGDAAYLASLGFRTTGFDFAAEAVAGARHRHPDADLDLRVADVLDLPAEWRGAFDLVLESLTIQSILPRLREEATAAVASLIAPGGSVVVIASALDEGEVDGPPWPLYRSDIDRFAELGLQPVSIDRVPPDDRFGTDPWLAEFRRPREPGPS